MAKQIIFTFEDKEYTLEFNRRTVKQMEEPDDKAEKNVEWTTNW